jgi:protocatechuate 3,4-dioxygenase beta subunit
MNLNFLRIALIAAVGTAGAGLQAALVAASQPTSQPTPQTAAGGSIEGVVVNVATGAPIVRAEVELTRVEGTASAPLAVPLQPAPAGRGQRGARGSVGVANPQDAQAGAASILAPGVPGGPDRQAVIDAISAAIQAGTIVPTQVGGGPAGGTGLFPQAQGRPRGRGAQPAIGAASVPSNPRFHFADAPEPAREVLPRVWTGDDGKFSLRDLKPGKYRLAATRSGGDFGRVEHGQRNPRGAGLAFSLGAGETLTGFKLEMVPTGIISGRVLNQNGGGVANAIVVGFEPRYKDGQRTLNIIQIVHANPRGEYRLRSLPPGEYYVSAREEDFQNPEPEYVPEPGTATLYQRASLAVISRGILPDGKVLEETYGSVFYGNVVDPEKAQQVDLRAGETRGAVDIAMKSMPTRHIRGTTVDVDLMALGEARASGPPRTNVQIRATRLQATSDFIVFMGQSDSNGVFDIAGLAPGAYIVTFGGFSSAVRVDVGDSDVAGVKLLLAPAGVNSPFAGRLTIEGKPSNEGVSAPANMQVRLTPDFSAALGGLNPQMRPFNETIDMVAAVTATGSFAVPINLRRGNYRVDVLGLEPNMYVQKISLGVVDVLKDGLLILATDSPQEYVKAVNGRLTAIGPAKTGPFANTLEIVIAADAGAINGTVLNSGEQPLSNAVVALVPAPNLRNRSDLFRSTTTDAAGQFSLRSIPPGDYKLFAWNYAPPDSWQDAAFLRKYEDDGAPVHIDAKGMRTERLRVVPKR